MLIVKVESNNIEKALRNYKNKQNKIKMVKELRERSEFEKPSVVKRNMLKKAIYVEKLKRMEDE